MVKKVWKSCRLLACLAVLLFGVNRADVYADAADFSAYDYQRENFTVTVQAQDGTDYLYLRYGPSMQYEVICKIYNGTVLNIDGTAQDPSGGFRWGNTEYNGTRGWVSLTHTVRDGSSAADLGTAVNKDVVVQAVDGSGYLYLRSGPGQDYGIHCNIYDGTVLHITRESTDSSGLVWGKTVYDGTEGWVSLKQTAAYTAQASPKYTERSIDKDVIVKTDDGSGYLYLRSGPGQNYDVYCNIYDGEVLHITGEVTDAGGQFTWGRTVYDGTEGWVSLKQTAVYKKPETTAAPAPSPKAEATPAPKAEKSAPEVTASPTPAAETPAPTVQPETSDGEEQPAASDSRETGKLKLSKLIIVPVIMAAFAFLSGIVLLVVLMIKKGK